YKSELEKIEMAYTNAENNIPDWQLEYNRSRKSGDVVTGKNLEQNIRSANVVRDSLRKEYKNVLNKALPNTDTNDTNYIFLRFVLDYLPAGLVGLLIAIIFLASWGSIAAAINSLASCTMIDFHRKLSKKNLEPEREYTLSKWYTLGWGIFCITVAMFTYNIGNSLIEAVNVLGSLFYGVILGVFIVAFFLKNIRSGLPVFLGALFAECLVLLVFIIAKKRIGFLWLNPIGVCSVILFCYLFQ